MKTFRVVSTQPDKSQKVHRLITDVPDTIVELNMAPLLAKALLEPENRTFPDGYDFEEVKADSLGKPTADTPCTSWVELETKAGIRPH